MSQRNEPQPMHPVYRRQVAKLEAERDRIAEQLRAVEERERKIAELREKVARTEERLKEIDALQRERESQQRIREEARLKAARDRRRDPRAADPRTRGVGRER